MLFLALAALYVLAPGHPALPFAGIPIGQSGIVALVLLALAGGLVRRRLVPRAAVITLAAAVALKLVAWTLASDAGWRAQYYANPTFDGEAERSIDYRSLDATRIDRTLAFADTSFPVHFFNDRRFDRGFRREYTEAFSVRWTGHIQGDTDRILQVVLRARGEARLLLDGREVARTGETASPGSHPVTLELRAGSHVLEARYHKPPNTEGLFELGGASASDDELLRGIAPRAQEGSRASGAAAIVLAVIAHAIAISLVVWICAPPCASWLLREARDELRTNTASGLLRVLEPAIVVGLTAQGLWKSRHLVDHVWTLTGGDDWMTFEHTARDVLLNGMLMTEGAPLGQGRAYFAYPGYTYFTALVHAVSGESLAGVILMNFVMLAVCSVFVLRLARMLLPPPAAVLAVGWLLLLQQADFVRYYTVTLLSENLYVATAAGAVLGFTRFVIEGRVRQAVAGGAWTGLSALTRPSAMLYLPCALAVTAAASFRHRRGPARAAVAVASALAACLLVISPATVRNYIVAGEPILISSGQAKSFIDFNMPPENQRFYLDMYDGSLSSAGIVLARMLIDQPGAVLGSLGYKVGFALGMVHWADGVSAHPELLLTSVLYLLSIALVPAARTLAALPLHVFVFTHLAAMTLSLPWNYGYRMILPMYPLMAVFAMAVPARVLPVTRLLRLRPA